MRHIGNIPHKNLVINVFKNDNKYILKVEIGPFEQVYKFLESDKIKGFQDIENLVNLEFTDSAFAIFDKMNAEYKKLII
ncbi:MAG: hypothetical protein K1X49_06595 [Saprospiraceae bacterium]|jgi:hypothetical protein|nr:hypothetical protein [Saprospiraceae bacterium]